jgi:hypothetical protein
MTREDIIRMAREAGLGTALCHNSIDGDRIWIEGADWHEEVERFAALVAAHTLANIDPSTFMSYQEGFEAGAAAEREACAKVAKETVCDMHLGTGIKIYGTRAAAAIRARGQA